MMAIELQRYEELIRYARNLVKNSGIDPYDIVHDAYLGCDSPSNKLIKTTFYEARRSRRRFMSGLETLPDLEGRIPTLVCTRCKDPLLATAFYRNAAGYYYTYCAPCRKAMVKAWRERVKNNPQYRELSRKYSEDFRQRHPGYWRKFYDTESESARRKKSKMKDPQNFAINQINAYRRRRNLPPSMKAFKGIPLAAKKLLKM